VSTITSGENLPVCSDGTYLELTRDVYCVIVSDHERWQAMIVPEGYRWDGASIPRCLWWLMGHPLSTQLRWASLWHDIGCREAQCIEDRTIADAVFLRLLREAGVGKWRRLAMWSAVRVYGFWTWRCRRGK